MILRNGRRESIDMGPAKSRLPQSRHEAEQRERYRRKSRARKYGLTLAELEELERKHDGHCGLCGLVADLHIDHDHATNRVRGLLCRHCNLLLGRFEKDPALFQLVVEKFAGYISQ